jgi:hypothetical protein
MHDLLTYSVAVVRLARPEYTVLTGRKMAPRMAVAAEGVMIEKGLPRLTFRGRSFRYRNHTEEQCGGWCIRPHAKGIPVHRELIGESVLTRSPGMSQVRNFRLVAERRLHMNQSLIHLLPPVDRADTY